MRRWRMGLASPGYPTVQADDAPGHADGVAPPRGRWARLWTIPAWQPTVLGAVLLGLILGVALRRMGEPSAFIYFRF